MTMDEFKKHTNVTFVEDEDSDEVQVFVIFSEGLIQTFTKDFVHSSRELATDLVTWNLREMLKKELNDG